MGMGDELMACGQAKARHLEDPQRRRVRILDRFKMARWHPLWEGCRFIAKPNVAGDYLYVLNGPGARPYIAQKVPGRWVWKDAAPPEPADLHFTRAERAYAELQDPGVVIEPTLKPAASPNKHWGEERWLAFVDMALRQGWRLTQLGPDPGVVLPGVKWIYTPDFRTAAAVLARAAAYVGHEGGLHHAAAAVRVPAVVIFGGFISPAHTGYAGHVNLYAGGEPCGMRVPCEHCAAAMAAIEPRQVLAALEERLQEAA